MIIETQGKYSEVEVPRLGSRCWVDLSTEMLRSNVKKRRDINSYGCYITLLSFQLIHNVAGVVTMNKPEMLRILMLAGLFGVSQITAANVTTAATSRQSGSASTLRLTTTSLRPITTTKNNVSDVSTSSLKTSLIFSSSIAPTSVRPTTTRSLQETTTLPLTTTPLSLTTTSLSPWTNVTNLTTHDVWTRDIAVIVIPCVVGFIVLVVVVIVIVFLVVRNKKKREGKRLSGHETPFHNRYEGHEMQEAHRDPQNNSTLGNEVTAPGQYPDGDDIYSNNIEVDNRPKDYLATRPSGGRGKRLDFPPRESVYGNQSEFMGDWRRPDSSYLNAADIERIDKPVSQKRNAGGQISTGNPGRQEVHKAKMEVPWTNPEEDEGDVYVNCTEVSGPTPRKTAPTPLPKDSIYGRWSDKLDDSVYANQVEMRGGGGEGWTNPRPESTDSSNYLSEKDFAMLRKANQNVSSIYAPRSNAVPRQ